MRDGGAREVVQLRYSEAFRRQIVGLVESGQMSIEKARRRYGIGGAMTIQRWIRRLGKNHLLAKVVRVETPAERDELKRMQMRIRQLEAALADSQVRVLALESLVDVVQEHYGEDVKKTMAPSCRHRSTPRSTSGPPSGARPAVQAVRLHSTGILQTLSAAEEAR